MSCLTWLQFHDISSFSGSIRLSLETFNERLCPKCNEIEDDSCALFDTVRKKFIKETTDIDQTFSQLNDKEFFIKLMTYNNCLILGKLLPFIRACFEIRRILGIGL